MPGVHPESQHGRAYYVIPIPHVQMGCVSLHWAAQEGRTDIVQALLRDPRVAPGARNKVWRPWGGSGMQLGWGFASQAPAGERSRKPYAALGSRVGVSVVPLGTGEKCPGAPMCLLAHHPDDSVLH